MVKRETGWMVLTGDKRLNKKLSRLSGKDSKKAIREAAKAALRPVLNAARRNAPEDEGLLKRRLKLRAMKKSRSVFGYRVQIKHSQDFYYGGFQEWGTVKMEAQEFMQRAADEKRKAALTIYRARLKQAIRRLTSG